MQPRQRREPLLPPQPARRGWGHRGRADRGRSDRDREPAAARAPGLRAGKAGAASRAGPPPGRSGGGPRRCAPLAVARELAGIDEDAAPAVADRMADLGLLRDGESISFAHPLVETAVLQGIPTAQRARQHRQAAELLESRGQRPERVAVQLLHAERGDGAWAREALSAAAEEATGRGAPESARQYLLRALEECRAEESAESWTCDSASRRLRSAPTAPGSGCGRDWWRFPRPGDAPRRCATSR